MGKEKMAEQILAMDALRNATEELAEHFRQDDWSNFIATEEWIKENADLWPEIDVDAYLSLVFHNIKTYGVPYRTR